MNELIKNRKFQLWAYKVSHQHLLIRSPQSDVQTRNIDVLFVGVKFIELETDMDELEFVEAEPNDSHDLNSKWFVQDSPYKLYILQSRNRRFRVVAVATKTYENTLDIFENGFEA